MPKTEDAKTPWFVHVLQVREAQGESCGRLPGKMQPIESMSVTVPEGLCGGMTLSIKTPNGADAEVIIPEGLQS